MNKGTNEAMGHERIVVVDALRGLALTGILLLHAIEHFDFYWPSVYNPAILAGVDKIVHDVMFFLFAGKSYAIFSLLFGFSFYIQMQRQEAKGNDFRGRFVWRLLVLLLLGYLHTLIYMGDILMIYAIMGMPLVLLNRVPTRYLLFLSVLLLMHVTRWYELFYSFSNPAFTVQRDWGDWGTAFSTFCRGTFLDVLGHNAGQALITKMKWTIASGRVYQLLGLFLMGIVLGRKQFFIKAGEKKSLLWKALGIGVLSLVVFQLLNYFFSRSLAMNDTQKGLLTELTGIFVNLSMLAVWVSGFMLAYYRFRKAVLFDSLSKYGKMSLSSYMMQPLIGVPLFYGYGLGLYQYLGHTLSVLYAGLFWVFQIWFCHAWFQKHSYGPLEWLWRSLTFFTFKRSPFQRPAKAT